MTEQQLIDLLGTDPERGVAGVLELYGGAIKVICANILRDFPKEDTEEAVSDTLVAIWRSAGRFDRTQGNSFKSYCYGIARKTALAKRKAAAGALDMIPLEEDRVMETDPVEEQYEQSQAEKLLHETIEELQEPARTIFILRYFYFFKVKEIAVRLGFTDKKVENCLCRGRQKLRDMLTQKGVDRG